MDFAELQRRLARLAEAGRPLGAQHEPVMLYESRPTAQTHEGHVLYRTATGMGLGYTERGRFSERELFDSEDAACWQVWNDRAREFARVGGGTPAYAVRALIAPRVLDADEGRRATTTTDFATFAASADPGVRSIIARREDCPAEVLELLSLDEETAVDVAANPASPPWLLHRLAGSQNPRVRYQVASNPSATAETLAALAGDVEPAVIWRVAKSPLTPVEVLAGLEASPHPFVHRFLGSNPSTPPEVLVRLAASDDFAVLWAVAANASTPPSVLEPLVAHADYGVRWSVARNPALADASALVGDEEVAVRIGLARRADPALLERLAVDPDLYVRDTVALNPAAPAALRITAALGAHTGTSVQLCREAETPADVLCALAQRHPDDWVRNAAEKALAER
jgi:hypothetical protein